MTLETCQCSTLQAAATTGGKRVISTLSWTPCSSSSPSQVTNFLFLAARKVPTNASNMFAHRSSLKRTPNFTYKPQYCIYLTSFEYVRKVQESYATNFVTDNSYRIIKILCYKPTFDEVTNRIHVQSSYRTFLGNEDCIQQILNDQLPVIVLCIKNMPCQNKNKRSKICQALSSLQ